MHDTENDITLKLKLLTSFNEQNATDFVNFSFGLFA